MKTSSFGFSSAPSSSSSRFPRFYFSRIDVPRGFGALSADSPRRFRNGGNECVVTHQSACRRAACAAASPRGTFPPKSAVAGVTASVLRVECGFDAPAERGVPREVCGAVNRGAEDDGDEVGGGGFGGCDEWTHAGRDV